MSDVTQLLQSIAAGDDRAAADLLPLVYEELRKLARARMSNEKAGHTFQATELVHEAYLRLVGGKEVEWDGRSHFFGAAAEAMRRILIDRARRRQAAKHGGDRQRVDVDEYEIVAPERDPEKLLRLNEALLRFEKADPLRSKLVELRYFAGLSNREAAEVLQISPSSADRYWVFAKAWLQKEMQSGTGLDKALDWSQLYKRT